jgi:hypothetical protein
VPAIDAWFFWFGKWVERTVLLATTNAGRWRTVVVVAVGGVWQWVVGVVVAVELFGRLFALLFKVEFVVLFVDVADTTNTFFFFFENFF